MKNICVFTGTRAEYGLLAPLMRLIQADCDLQLQLLVSGMHLAPEFGLTYREIEADGFQIDDKAEILLSSDSPVGMAKSTGLGMMNFSESFARLQPDLVLLLGDRFETFAAATAALLLRIPVAHLHGGESTRGAVDEALRHSISKMSYLHFVSTDEYRRRVIQLGEHPERVFNVGAIGLGDIRRYPLLSRAEVEHSLGFSLQGKVLLTTFHPVTLDDHPASIQMENLLNALEQLADTRIIFTKANADAEGRNINAMIDEFVSRNPSRSAAFTSLGQRRYLSAMKLADAVVGNSSSGIIEAPSLGTPTVNIGTRQLGRVMGKSIINCPPETNAIVRACGTALSEQFKKIASTADNPYEQSNTPERILETIKQTDIRNLRKVFFDLPNSCFEATP